LRTRYTNRDQKIKNLVSSPIQIAKGWQIILITVIIIGSGFFVYATGGIKYVYSHTMYIAIMLAAYFFNVSGGILAGVIAGLILGPFMPLNVETGEMQSTINWLYRLGIFTVVGIIQGHIFSLVKKQIEELKRLALFNRHTNLPNREHLLIDLDEIIEKCDPTIRYALFVIFLDNHAKITRILETDEIDRLNMKVAERLVRATAGKQKVYQILPYSLCILYKVDENEEECCQKIADAIYDALKTPFEINRVPVFINISTGIAIDKVGQISPTYFVQKATVAAQIASEKEIKAWEYHLEEFDSARTSQVLLGDVLWGLDQHEFALHYQPIVRLQDREIKSVEALLRWKHHEYGMIPPLEFLPNLEHTSLLYSIHDWEMEAALKQLAQWDGFEGTLTINLSTRLLLDDSWINKFEKLLDTYQINAGRIVFEITETAIMKDIENSRVAINQLKEMGSLIAMDDFGTGYSSLGYVQILPVDHLKIDRRFITDVHSSVKNQKIVRMALSLARSIEVETVAEGIESQVDYDWLLHEGCTYGQGFLMGKPMPGSELMHWIHDWKNSYIEPSFE